MPRRATDTGVARRGAGMAAIVIAAWLLAAPSAAQPCTGDCRGRGAVGISDLILAVNIALGEEPSERCAALGDGPVDIARLIASVSNALCDCRPCPTPPPARDTPTRTATPSVTPSRTRTATATPTASPSPTATPVRSYWFESGFKLPSSNCPQRLVTQLRQAIAGQTDELIVYERGDASELETGSGRRIPATLDAAGVLRARETQSDSEGTCEVFIDVELEVNLRRNPAAATYRNRITSRNCPTMLNCSVRITSTWVPRPSPFTLPLFSPLPTFPPFPTVGPNRGGGGTIVNWTIMTE